MDTQKIRDEELDRLVEALNKYSRLRKEIRKEQIEKFKTEQMKFLTRCRDLVRQVILVPEEVKTDIPLEQAYQLFESVGSSFQT